MIGLFPYNIIRDLTHHALSEEYGITVVKSKAHNQIIFKGKNSLVGFNSGAVISLNSKSKKLFVQSVSNLSRAFSWGKYIDDVPLKEIKVTLKDKEYFYPLATFGYYHFLLEILPRLLITLDTLNKHDEKLVIHLANPTPSYVHQLLQLVQDRYNFRIITTNIKCNSIVERVVFTEFKCSITHQIEHINILKDFFVNLKNKSTPKNYKKIYISRSKTPKRKITNERSIENLLIKEGFFIAHLQDYSIIDQLAIIRNAEIIVATHGAGLSNLIFCDSTCKIVELINKEYINYCFKDLSHILDIKYQNVYYELDKKNGINNIELIKDAIIKAIKN
jgi:hypothetical protein